VTASGAVTPGSEESEGLSGASQGRRRAALEHIRTGTSILCSQQDAAMEKDLMR
jgi:hypothetical protein